LKFHIPQERQNVATRASAVASKEPLWPVLETGYDDEFGSVDPVVHRAAGDLWSCAEHLACNLLHDSVAGYRLLKQAVAAVSQLAPERRAQIRDLPAYLFQTYKRLVLAELEKRNAHSTRQLDDADLLRWPIDADRIDRNILIQELVGRMDPWSRNVFETLSLGYSFDEIGKALGRNPHVVRNRFRLAIRKLASRIGAPVSGQGGTPAKAGRITAESIERLRMMRNRLLNPSGWISRRDS
jgi:DNA-binding CsgD family transcriptional regulator